MAHHAQTLACLVVLLALTSGKEQSRWSRQISSYTADISDWVPLAGPVQRELQSKPPVTPIKRQAVAEPRILTEPFPGFTRPTGFSQESFPSRTFFNSPANRQLYLQSVPSAPQNYLTDQGFGQSIRFGLSQPNFVNPLNQGFISPQFTFDNPPPPVVKQPIRHPAPPQNPIKFENYPKQNTAPIPQLKPFTNQATKPKPEAPKFVDGYRFENSTNDFAFNKKKAQSLQKLKFENEQLPKTEIIPSKPKVEREEVQLLYVPLESLNRGQFNFKSPMTSPHIINSDFYSQGLPKADPLKQTFAADFQRPVMKPIESFGSGQQYYSNFDTVKTFDQVPKFSTITSPFPTTSLTTPKPKKLKPHQPPLAIFQETKKNSQIKVGDVLSSLKNANTIAVLDSVNPSNAPKVFIGPSSLTPPENFVKFELPYLSNIDNIDKKLRQLPFFVAPLSYNTPQGFAKIPFPSPHVGSVVINSLMKETTPSQSQTLTTPRIYTTQAIHSTPSANIIPNSYPDSLSYKQEQKPATQKTNFNYYSTISPKTNAPLNQQQKYYSFEPQTVTSISPQHQPEPINTAPQKGNYFLTNVGDQYSQFVNFPSQNNYRNPEPAKSYTAPKPETTTTSIRTTTTTTTTSKPSTFSSQLLETHNPYSINQAFHFSTPLDYHNYFDDFKDTYAPPGVSLELPKTSQHPVSSTPILPSKSEEIATERSKQQTSPNYLQNYTPEIHYESEIQHSKYPIFNANDYTTKTEVTSEPHISTKPDNTVNVEPFTNQTPQTYGNINYQSPVYENLTETIINRITGPSADVGTSKQKYDQYETHDSSGETRTSSSPSTTTTTTTTRRTPIRSRGRPRYTTAKTDSNEATTRAAVTRRPLTQRRTLPPRSKYEPNKISTERTTKKSFDSNESTTKSSRTRVRGRIQYKPSDNDEYYDRRNKVHNTKEDDIAYQRDILHQNYPVTLMERTSTVDIEAITEPVLKISSTKTLESGTETYDTENAYAHESAAISQVGADFKETIPNYTSRAEPQYEDISVPKYSSTRSEEYYQSRSSIPTQSFSSHDDSLEKQDDNRKQTTPNFKAEKSEESYVTDPVISNTEQPNYSVNYEQLSKQEDLSTNQDVEITKIESPESVKEEEPEDNVVQTTPSYNRVRVRPGVIRQYHQASSTESSRTKIDRRRPIQAVTYRPAFDKRRTTMRIEEIEADLKTKQVHTRPEVQEHRHPVYKPEPSTEPSPASSSTQETVKRGHFRRRRPTYSTTTTEASSTKRIYEAKNRFRGRRPTTERPTEKPEIQTEPISTTARNVYSRYSHRPRLSERFNKKPEPETEESEDQDSNYSISRPKYIVPETEQWSPKITAESFKPYNPNDIADETKIATTERRSDKLSDAELDIITARNDYDDILISVTPASNNKDNKKIPDIPPTLEALVEQSKTTKSDTSDTMSTFETMLEEVMKSLEEQDENEYTSHVMKHKGGEIGEIPPERVISSGEDIAAKTTTALDQEATTAAPTEEESTDFDQEKDRKSRRRGFWKKVKVRPSSTESIEAAESQYYPNTVNRLGETVKFSKAVHEKSGGFEKPKLSVTTYKPTLQFIPDIFGTEEVSAPDTEALLDIDIPKIDKQTTQNYEPAQNNEEQNQKHVTQVVENEITTVKTTSVGDEDLGTGSPDSTLMDDMYFSTPTEPTASETMLGILDKSDSFSFMDYLFGTTSSDDVTSSEKQNLTVNEDSKMTTKVNIEVTTEQVKPKITTTETSYIPEEITGAPSGEDNTENITEFDDIKKVTDKEKPRVTETAETSTNVESSSVSSFMHPSNVVSTSMSTEVSHETEICFRGKCIKTSKDIL